MTHPASERVDIEALIAEATPYIAEATDNGKIPLVKDRDAHLVNRLCTALSEAREQRDELNAVIREWCGDPNDDGTWSSPTDDPDELEDAAAVVDWVFGAWHKVQDLLEEKSNG